MEFAAILISILALMFTVASFWYMNWRPGVLHIGRIRSYAAIAAEPHLVIAIPVAFSNRGALPVLVDNLRLRLPDHGDALTALWFDATVAKLGSQSEGRQLAIPFVVHGGDVVVKVCEFRRQRSGFVFEEGRYKVAIDVRTDRDESWVESKSFELSVPAPKVKVLNSEFRAHEAINMIALDLLEDVNRG